MVLVGIVGILNAASLGQLLLAKTTFGHDLPASLISPQRRVSGPGDVMIPPLLCAAACTVAGVAGAAAVQPGRAV